MSEADELIEKGRERHTNRLKTRIFWSLVGVVVFMTTPALALFSKPLQVWMMLGFAAAGVAAAYWLADYVMLPVYVLRRRLEIKNYGGDHVEESPAKDLDLSGSGFELAALFNQDSPRRRLDLEMPLPRELVDIERLSRAGRVSQIAMETVRGEFHRHMSHGLKTPLALLKSHCETVVHAVQFGDTGTLVESARTISTLSQHVAELVSQILSLAFVNEQAGKGVLSKKANLSAAVMAVCDVRKHAAEEKGMTLDTSVEASLWVRGDRGLLQEMMASLIDNAVRYAPAQTPIKIEAAKVPGSQTVLVVITDRGPGVPVGERERVFEPFYGTTGIDERGNMTFGSRAHRVLGAGVDKKSHGLGLALVKGIVRMHGAQISLDSGPGGIGLAVRIVLNACEPPRDDERGT